MSIESVGNDADQDTADSDRVSGEIKVRDAVKIDEN